MNEKPSYEELESRIRRLEETEKKLRGTEAALNESRRRFVTLMDNLPGMVYRCRNDPRWTVEFISEGCLSLTGYDPSDFIGGSLVSLLTMIHEDDRQMVSTEVQAAVAETRPFQLEYRIVTAAGDEKWVWERGGLLPAQRAVKLFWRVS
jgi:PAS domain-containing protein